MGRFPLDEVQNLLELSLRRPCPDVNLKIAYFTLRRTCLRLFDGKVLALFHRFDSIENMTFFSSLAFAVFITGGSQSTRWLFPLHHHS